MAISNPLRAVTKVVPEFVFSQNRAIANAGAAVELGRRAAAERAAAEASGDLESVIERLSRDVVA